MAIVTRRDLAVGRYRWDGIHPGMVFITDVPPAHCVGSEQTHQDPWEWLIVSHDRVQNRFPIVLGVPLTTQVVQEEKFRVARVRIQAALIHPTSVPRPMTKIDVLALTEQVRALSHERLKGEPIAYVDKTALLAVEAGLKHVLGIP